MNLLVLIQSEVCSLSDTRLRKFAVKSKILKNGRFVWPTSPELKDPRRELIICLWWWGWGWGGLQWKPSAV